MYFYYILYSVFTFLDIYLVQLPTSLVAVERVLHKIKICSSHNISNEKFLLLVLHVVTCFLCIIKGHYCGFVGNTKIYMSLVLIIFIMNTPSWIL